MREPFTQLYVHLVWATWDREPLLVPEIRDRVYACIRQECRRLKADLIAVGGTADHVHVLVRLPSTVSVAELAKQIKGASSHLVNHELLGGGGFRWQGAYAAFTVSRSLGPTVREYIVSQEQHHREGTTDKFHELAWEEKALPPGD